MIRFEIKTEPRVSVEFTPKELNLIQHCVCAYLNDRGGNLQYESDAIQQLRWVLGALVEEVKEALK